MFGSINWSIHFPVIIVTVLTLIILRIIRARSNQRSFWTKRNFLYVSSVFEIRQSGGYLEAIKSIFDLIGFDLNLYDYLKRRNVPHIGISEFGVPTLFVKDLNLIKEIYVKHFENFADRRDFKLQDGEQLVAKMLTCLEGEEWRALRTKMTPTFTTGKIRRMFDIMNNSGERFVNYLQAEIQKSSRIDIADSSGKFLLDVIAGTAFGINSGVFAQKDSYFEKMADKYHVTLSVGNVLKFLTIIVAPKIAGRLGLSVTDKEADNFFSRVIMDTIKQREETGEMRHDFLQILMEARNQKISDVESDGTRKNDAACQNLLSDKTICAQSILFFIAGFDTTQALLQFAAYQLALNPDVQDKLAKEIEESLDTNGGKFTYDAINSLECMDKVVSETLRMHVPSYRLERRCTQDHVIESTDLVIPKGALIVLPVHAIHHDDDIYPNPTQFDPERFSKENKANRNPYAYMPFGHGPRNCLGRRFALTESKLAIAYLVHNYNIQPCEDTPIPMTYANSPSLKPAKKIFLTLTRK